ncbi:type II secretion system F family protein [bacterium]|nr:type II secretion system F family protein [bacterium]
MYSQQDLLTFWEILAKRTCAGQNLVSSLEIISNRLADSPLAEVARSLGNDLRNGLTLTEAMSKHPDAFKKHVLCWVEGGEMAGILDRMFVFILESAWRCPDCILGTS